MEPDTFLDELMGRRDELRAWLRSAAPRTACDQAHLDSGSDEQAYWTHGYHSALDDVISLLVTPRSGGISGKSTH